MKRDEEPKQEALESEASGLEVAIIGMAGRFPGANNIEEFWDNLKNGVESIGFFSGEELEEAGVEPGQLNNPDYVKVAGKMDRADYFDASFFGYTPREARTMPPQVRIFHCCVWEALEDAGITPDTYDGRIGLYAGASSSTHWEVLTFLESAGTEDDGFTRSILANKDNIATQIAFQLNLKGPAVVVQTACSTSLVAVHLAVQGLLNGESEVALAGGVTVSSDKKGGYFYQEGMIMSKDGHVRAFDANANGVVGGNGAAVVVLKALEDAAAHHDHIYAVIKGSAINNDGTRKVGYTAPSVNGQAEVIKAAQYLAGVAPETIGYIEAHGTATALGDPVEIEALTLAFKTGKRNFCAIGSVKTNVGHLDNASGAAGLIKAALALYHKFLPPSLHFETPNPHIDFKNSPFFVVTTPGVWRPHDPRYPLRAGVSSFGIGGTNAHVILEEASIAQGAERKAHGGESQGRGGVSPPVQSREYRLIVLSARTGTALERMSRNLAKYLQKNFLNQGNHKNPTNPGPTLADAAYTLQVGRKVFPCRRALAISGHDIAGAASALRQPPGAAAKSCTQTGPAIFMFSGLGAQYVNMGRGLYENQPLFRGEMDRCFRILQPLLEYNLKEILYPPLNNGADRTDKTHNLEILRIDAAQAAVFVFEYALARLIMSWGIRPRAMIGYSFGEYIAAAVSGVFSLEGALKLVAIRGRLLEKAPPGVMISVPLPKEELQPLLPADLSLAIDNGDSCIVGGTPGAAAAFEKKMKDRRCITMRLETTRAVHTHLMDPILAEFQQAASGIPRHPPTIPYISNVTGQWTNSGDVTAPQYWARHLRQTVRYAEGIQLLAGQPHALFLEIGPGRELVPLAARYVDRQRTVNLVRPAEIETPDLYYLWNKIGKLWQAGAAIDWTAVNQGEARSIISLPTYPFERQRYWIEDNLGTRGAGPVKMTTASAKSSDLADWFYIPTWKQCERTGNDAWEKDRWLVFLDRTGLGDRLVSRLREKGCEVVNVTAGSQFQHTGHDRYIINPDQPGHYPRLVEALGNDRPVPNRVLHLWNLIENPGHLPGNLDGEEFESLQRFGFYSLVYLAKAMGERYARQEFRIEIISAHLHDITGEEILQPAKATLAGPLKVIPQEYPNIRCRGIDVVYPGTGGRAEDMLLDQVMEEITGAGPIIETGVAFRGPHRWIRTYEPIHCEEPLPAQLVLRKKGVYLITGGMGKIGLMLAELLVKTVEARLILTGRTPLHRQDQWKKDKIRELEALGAEILTYSVDAADFAGMKAAVTEAGQRLGPLNGVIHAAGHTDDAGIQTLGQMTAENVQRHFQPKVYGTLVLEKLFRGSPLDFCLLVSSISTVLGGLGFTAYAAANAFMDVFVAPYKRGPGPGPRWISVDWDGMEPAKTQRAFKRIFALPKAVNRVVVSNGGNLRARIDKWIQLTGTGEEEKDPEPHAASLQPRPNLAAPYAPPQTPIEKTITEVFQKMFGYEQIGIHDDFFELGLDSIKAIQIRARMNKKGYSIQLEDFFKNPTAAALAPMVETLAENTAGVGKKDPEDPSRLTPTAPLIPAETMKILQTRYPDQIQDVYPLTPMQEGMLFYSLYETANIQPYFEQVSYRLHREMDVALIEKSTNELIRRHDILRTAFVNEGLDRPLQVVLKERNVEFTHLDLREIHPGNREARGAFIAGYKEKDKRRSFNLSSDVLIRLSVLQSEEAEYELIWSYHHALMDGWCMNILTVDYFTIYKSLQTGQPHGLPPVPPYRTYIQWLERQDKARALGFWKTRLQGFEEMTAIPKKKNLADKALVLQEEFAGAGISAELEIEQTRRLQEIAVRTRVTLSTIFHALWAILLGKYNGKQDVVFGSVVSGRPPSLEGIENMVGCFINTIPVRVRFDGQTPFDRLIRQLQEDILRTEPYHYFSLAEIQAQTPLKQNLLDHFIEFQNYPIARQIEEVGDRLKHDNITETRDLSHIQVFEQGNYDFIFDIMPGERMRLSFSYNANVYDTELVTRLGRHTLNVLEQITRDSEIPIRGIRLLTEEEERQILVEFNKRGDFDRDKTVIHHLEKHALQTPHRTAVVYRDTVLTYRELHDRARDQAVKLKAHGIGPDRTVGISMRRTPLMMICILGAWQAGGAYLPIDPGYPKERIDYMLKDSGARILVSRVSEVSGVSKGIEIIDIHQLKSKEDFLTHLTQHTHLTQLNLAYIIYTSGSTGTPKGVMIEHTGMMNHIRVKIHDLDLNSGSIVAQNATHTFDISVWQFFAPLITGGRTIIYPGDVIMEPGRFWQELEKDGITVLEVVPSYLAMMLDAVDIPGENSQNSRKHPNLDYLLVTGEEIKPALVEQWFAKYPGTKMVNAYGPTEASDDITHYIMDKAPAGERIPIGHPVQNMTVSIVDDFGQPCPIGVKGEIRVTGPGVGRGYLNNPELTANKFLSIFNRSYRSYRSYISKRFYMTGDVGRWLPGGVIEFFGRKDDQVKIRGFRIELGEIERRLMGHSQVKEAVVTAGKDGGDEPCLRAYFVPARPGDGNIAGELKDYLTGVLPSYMVPTHFIGLEKIPLAANGKVDYKRLPGPPENTAPSAPPAAALEVKLAGLWAEVLSLPPGTIGMDDDFIRLGGHSLKAMLLLDKIHREMQIKVPLAELFHSQTIRRLARYMEKTAPQKFIPLEAVEKKEYYPLSPAQKRLYVLQRMNPAGIAYNLPQFHELPEAIGEDAHTLLEDIFKKLIRRHESLRTSFRMIDDIPVQQIHEHVEFAIEYYQDEEGSESIEGTRGLAPLSIESAVRGPRHVTGIISSFIRPFDFARAPLLRVGLIRLENQKHLLLVDMHHIITDGISNGILIREIMTLAAGKTLDPPRVQYRDFSGWQNHLWEKGGLEQQEAFWLEEFSGELPVLDLAADYLRPVPRDFSGAVESFRFEDAAAAELRSMAQAEGVTLYMLVSAILNILLSKISGGEDIVVGSPVAGRRHIDLAGVIGMFVNTLPLRNFPVREKTFGEFLLEVKQRTLAAFENQDYPFEELVEKIAVHRDLGRNPIFDVLYMCETVEGGAGAIDDQTGEEEKSGAAEGAASKFDMSWRAVETGNRLTLSVEYCTALFKKETIKRFIACFERVVFSVLEAGRGLELGAVEIIPEAEKKRILLEFNDTKVDYPGHKTLDRLFFLRVEQDPDYAALLWRESVVTYRELGRGIGQLARQLRQKGIGPGVIAAVMMERSPGMLIAVFAILRAGGAYLPIDPDYPPDRIDYMLKDSQAKILLKDNNIGPGKFETNSVSTPIVLNFEHLKFEFVSDFEFRASNFSSSSPAYVIYTSGTTGRPRGVVVCHYSVVNRLQWMQKAYPAAPGDVVLQKTPFTFDVSVWELFWWYLGGAAVCLAPLGSEKDPEALIHVIEKQRVTFIHFVPSMLGAFLEYAATGNMGERLKCLRQVFASGEKLELHHVGMFNRVFALKREELPVPQLSNLYGPTEAAVEVSYYNCPAGEKPDLVPIGKPIHNTVLYILDQEMNHQPPGVTGELCIGGVQVARGYLNRPELTAEKFKINQKFLRGGPGGAVFSKSAPPGRRRQKLYKTGDLARWLNDGNIEFLGRMDYQVKVRGNRIELGEIEARLRECPGVKEAVAAVKQDRDGNNYLCAYLVESGSGAAGEPGQYLSTVLPEYMIPSFFIYLETLPHTPSGKIHRRALPRPDEGTRTGAAAEYVPPGTPLENTLAELWRQVLGIENPGIRDNFFRLGGHSLGAIKLAAGLKNKGFHLSINEIFLYPTIQGQAQRIGLNHELGTRAYGEFFAAGSDPGEPVNAPGEDPAAEELWGLLQGQWVDWEEKIIDTREVRQYKITAMQRMQWSKPGRNRPIPIFFHQGLETGLLRETLREMVENQGLLRSVIREKQGEWYCVEFSAPPGLSVPFVDLTDRPPRMRDQLMLEIVHRILKEDFGQNSLLYRVVCFKRDKREYVLVLVIDHTIYDGMSKEIITRQIATAYSLKEAGREQPRVRPGSYADYAAHILRGPRGIGPAELIEMFDLKAFAAAKRELERIVLEKAGPVKLFTREIPFPAGMGEEGVWEFAFWYFVLFTGRALGMRELPLQVAAYGRRFGEKTFFDTVGDFADMVPVLVRIHGNNSRQMAETASERIGKAARHSINFMTLVSEPSLREKWQEAVGLLMAGKFDTTDSIMVFNLVGGAPEDRIRGFKPGAVTLEKEMKGAAIDAEIYYGPRSLYIYLTTSLDIKGFEEEEITWKNKV